MLRMIDINYWAKDKTIIIWGSGRIFEIFRAQNQNLFIKYITGNTSNGGEIQNIQFLDPQTCIHLIKTDQTYKFIICSSFYNEIKLQLIQAGLYPYNDFFPYYAFETQTNALKKPPTSYMNLCEKILNLDVEIHPFHSFSFEYAKTDIPFFKMEKNNDKKILFLRHDVDHDPLLALEMAKVEHSLAIKSTYFLLSTDTLKPWMDSPVLKEKFFAVAKEIQSLGHEIGLHYDAIGDFLYGDINPVENIKETLSQFSENQIHIVGCSAHGSYRTREITSTNYSLPFPQKYINYNIWKELNPHLNQIEHEGNHIILPSCFLSDIGLQYEAYFVYHDCYLSDTGGAFWRVEKKFNTSFENIPIEHGFDIFNHLSCLPKNSIIQLLIHPIWWENHLI